MIRQGLSVRVQCVRDSRLREDIILGSTIFFRMTHKMPKYGQNITKNCQCNAKMLQHDNFIRVTFPALMEYL